MPPFPTVGTTDATRGANRRSLSNPSRPSESCLSTENSNSELANCGSRVPGSPPKLSRNRGPKGSGGLVAVGAVVAVGMAEAVGNIEDGVAVASPPQAVTSNKTNSPLKTDSFFKKAIFSKSNPSRLGLPGSQKVGSLSRILISFSDRCLEVLGLNAQYGDVAVCLISEPFTLLRILLLNAKRNRCSLWAPSGTWRHDQARMKPLVLSAEAGFWTASKGGAVGKSSQVWR